MSKNNSDKTKKNPALPELAIKQTKYCDQKTIDNILRYLQEQNPDLIADLIDDGQRSMNTVWNNLDLVVHWLRDREDSYHIGIPSSRIAMMEIIYELDRRAEKIRRPFLNQWDDLIGVEIAAGPDDPMPVLPVLTVKEYTAPAYLVDKNISQECVDLVSQKLHELRPDLIYEISESLRRRIPSPEVHKEFLKFLNDLSSRGLDIPADDRRRMRILQEISKRIKLLCKIS